MRVDPDLHFWRPRAYETELRITPRSTSLYALCARAIDHRPMRPMGPATLVRLRSRGGRLHYWSYTDRWVDVEPLAAPGGKPCA